MANKARLFHDILEARTQEVQAELAELEAEYKRIEDLEANPHKCIEALRKLNEDGGKPTGDLDKLGRIRTRIVIDAEQSLNERAFRVNKVTRQDLGWSETDVREWKDMGKRKGRRRDSEGFDTLRESEGLDEDDRLNTKEEWSTNSKPEVTRFRPEEAKSLSVIEKFRHEDVKGSNSNKIRSPEAQGYLNSGYSGDSKLPSHMFAQPYIPTRNLPPPEYNQYYEPTLPLNRIASELPKQELIEPKTGPEKLAINDHSINRK